MRRLFVSFSILLVLAAGVLAFLRYAPDRYDPFAPLAIGERPSFLTQWKLRRLKGDSAACFAALDSAGIAYRRMPDRETGNGCGFRNAARLTESSLSWGTGGLPLSCPMIAALAVWERHDLQPAAARLFGSAVARLDHYGSYACRNVNNAATGRRSEHARANAIDVAGFVLEDGRRISVRRHWGDDGARGRFLGEVHGAACGRFANALGPDYNAAHADHFHLDMAGFGTCR